MKKSIYLFLGIVLIAALSSCSGNDDDDENFDMPSEKTIYVGDSIRSFSFAMILGVVFGTLSSLFIAAPTAFLVMGRTIREEETETKA